MTRLRGIWWSEFGFLRAMIFAGLFARHFAGLSPFGPAKSTAKGTEPSVFYLICLAATQLALFFFFWLWIHTASAPITAGMHTDGSSLIRKPRSAWLEGTPAMDHGLNGKRMANTYTCSQIKEKYNTTHIKKHGTCMKNTHVEQWLIFCR